MISVVLGCQYRVVLLYHPRTPENGDLRHYGGNPSYSESTSRAIQPVENFPVLSLTIIRIPLNSDRSRSIMLQEPPDNEPHKYHQVPSSGLCRFAIEDVDKVRFLKSIVSLIHHNMQPGTQILHSAGEKTVS